MKRSILLVLGVLILGSFLVPSPVLAVPITNTAGDGTEDRTGGAVFGYYQNSGTLLFTKPGNNGGALQYAALQAYMLENYHVVLTATGDTAFTNHDGNSGTWYTVPPLGPSGTISYYAVKAGNYFAMYGVNPADSEGSWSTYDIWAIGGPGTGGHPANGGGGLAVSHFTGYNPAAVPEPATMLFLGVGLIGLAGFGRRLFK